MRSSVLAPALMATLALSKPLDKRYLTTVVDMVTVYQTVTLKSGPTPGAFFPISDPGSSTVTTVTVTSGDAAPSSTSEVVVVPVESTSEVASEAPAVATTAATTAEAAVATTATSATGANDYQNAVLTQHNIHRANHSASSLTWSDSLAATAQKIASSCVYAHDTTTDGGGYGQNIGAGTPAEDVGSMITDQMYNGEIGFYPLPFGVDSPSMTNFEKWGHFSQIVWKETTQIGCATVQCASLANVGGAVQPYFTVCNYSPPGNFAGEYSNVGAPLGQDSVTV